MLRDYQLPDRALFREFFVPNAKIIPNWVCPHLLALLVHWMAPAIAEKAVLSLYLLLFPLSIRYCLNAIRRHGGALAIAAIPFVPNQFYHLGFQDFCLSLAGFFIALGYYLSHRRRFNSGHAAVLAFLLLLTYLTHLLSALFVMPAIGIIAIFQTWRARKSFADFLQNLLPVIIAFVPVTAATLYFVLQPHTSPSEFAYPKGWAHRFYFLLSWMKGLGSAELIPIGVVVLLYWGLTFWILWRARRTGRWNAVTTGLPGAMLIAAGAYYFVFTFASDYAAGGQFILVRLAAYPMFAILLWWAAIPLRPAQFRKLQMLAAAVCVPALLVMLILDWRNYIEANRYLDEFDAIAPLVAPNSTLLPVHFDDYATMEPDHPHREIAVGVDPFRHAVSFGLAERGIVNLSDYWASTDHHIVRWHGKLDPLHGGTEPLDDFDAYTQRTGMPIDYVVIWTGGLPHDDVEGRAIKSQLKEYDLIYRSGDGYLLLYRRIGFGGTASNPAKNAPAVRPLNENIGGNAASAGSF